MDATPRPEAELEMLLQQENLAADPTTALRRAELLEILARYPEALRAYEDVQAMLKQAGQSADPLAEKGRGSVLFRMGRYEDSLETVAASARLRNEQGLPEDWELSKIRGNCLCRLGRFNEALAAYSRAEDIQREQGQPVYPFLSMNRGAVYQELGRLEDALREFDNTQRLLEEQGQPPDHDLEMNRGVVLSFMLRPDEALEAYERAMALLEASGLPEDPNMLMNLGDLLSELGQTAEALDLFRRSEELRSERGQEPSHVLMFHRAMALHKSGSRDQAIVEAMRSIKEAGRQGIAVKPFYTEYLQDWLSPADAESTRQSVARASGIPAVPDSEKRHDVFVCYRRDPGLAHAMLLKLHLEMKGKSVFRDQDNLAAGRFEDDLAEAIRHSRCMLLLLSPGFFERCISDNDDVVRREIAVGLASGITVIPLMMEGFVWPAAANLPEDIKAVCRLNAMSYSSEFFTAFIDKLLSWMGSSRHAA